MHASTIFAFLPVLMTGVMAQQCHVQLRNQAGQQGCFNFGREAFRPNTVFPLGGSCSLQASPENNPSNPCAGFVNNLTPACGTGRDITFATGLCPVSFTLCLYWMIALEYRR